jgi:anti-anti-sigma regulatory factor
MSRKAPAALFGQTPRRILTAIIMTADRLLQGICTMDDSNKSLPSAEDMVSQYALTDDGVLRVYSAGPVTVLGFGGQDVPSEFNAAHYRAAITDLVRLNSSSTVAFDLTGVRLVPSGMLGLLVSLTRIKDLPLIVQVFNPSQDVREVLEVTKLNRMIEVHEVNIDRSPTV